MTAASDRAREKALNLARKVVSDAAPIDGRDPVSIGVLVNGICAALVAYSAEQDTEITRLRAALDQARAEALEEAASVVLMTPLFKQDLTVKSSIERDKRMAAAIRALQGGSDAG